MTCGRQRNPGTRKFLIVDDHPGFRQVLRAFLPSGMVTECSNGREALACYAVGRHDWVLMDIEMPGMDGFETASRLKGQFPEARIIFVSQHDGEDIHRKAQKIGINEFVQKERLAELRLIIEATDGHAHPS